MANNLDPQVLSKAEAWLNGNYDETTKQEVRMLIENNPNELVEVEVLKRKLILVEEGITVKKYDKVKITQLRRAYLEAKGFVK